MTQRETCFARWTAGTCKANGIDIHYLRSGGAYPPLIALHGLFGNGACLAPLARMLQDSCDVILPDARGHGRSSAPAEGYLYRDLAADVVGLIAGLTLDAPILLGHSMGGMTASVVASKLGSAISGVVLIEPTFISLERQHAVFASDLAAEQRRLLASGRSALLAQARRRHQSRSAEILECLVDARLQTSLSALAVLTPPNPDYHQLIRSMRAPTLLVIGGNGIVSLDTARALQALNPLLRYTAIPEGGHGLPYDQPERLAAVIMPFLHALPACAGSTVMH